MIRPASRYARLTISMVLGLALLVALFVGLHINTLTAAPIDPPDGYPKLSISTKAVTPTLAATGGAHLTYTIAIRNTGAYTAAGTTVTDTIPANTTFAGTADASSGPTPTVSGGALTWTGDVGFDEAVLLTFTVDVAPAFAGTVRNTAVIHQAMIAEPVTATAETVVTDAPILTIEKRSAPAKPGPNLPLFYTLTVSNQGQPVANLPITVTDEVPADTAVRDVGAGGTTDGNVVTWTRTVDLDLGDSTVFTFSVDVDDVPSGTVITNETYQVASAETGISAGDAYTVTIVDPIFSLTKDVWPDPPGSNREMTYTLTLLNQGSLATDIVVTDRVPAGVTYVRGGSESAGVVSWSLPSLETGDAAAFTYTVYISDVAKIPIVNDDYAVCSAQDVCAAGGVITSVIEGPKFAATAELDPIAHKPGGGSGSDVTPTLTIRNLGPGNAIDAYAKLRFERISISKQDVEVIPSAGTLTEQDCGEKCDGYLWVGSMGVGDVVTFTTSEGQSTIGGDEGTPFTATVVVTDSLSNIVTKPVTGTETGTVTKFANLIPRKRAPAVIGRGQLLTYTILVDNTALSTDAPPVLTDRVPMSTTFVNASDGGVMKTMSDTSIVSWTLPLLSTGEDTTRSFTVRVNDDLISGTQIINDAYRTRWFEPEAGRVFSNTGQPVTTTVKEVGLIDSFKRVTPTLASPGTETTLTYSLHIVNSGPLSATDVTVYDILPWEDSTYRRDAVATAGGVVSDIVSIEWTGDVAPFSSEIVTFTVDVDAGFEGAITNTAAISQADLLAPVNVDAVAYITDAPVLQITKQAERDTVKLGGEITYTLRVRNLGQPATDLFVTDTIPAKSTYVADSASGNGQRVGDHVEWQLLSLDSGETREFGFRVTADRGPAIVNDQYGVSSGGGVGDVGEAVTVRVTGGTVYLPIVAK